MTRYRVSEVQYLMAEGVYVSMEELSDFIDQLIVNLTYNIRYFRQYVTDGELRDSGSV